MGKYEIYSSQDGTKIESYFVAPPGKKSPAVIMLRGVAGPDSGYTGMADALSAAGYAALVHRWQVRGDDPDDATLIADIRAAIDFLRSRPEVDAARIAAFGYCKGGGQALLAAAALPEIRTVVAFHGFAKRPNGPDAAHRNPIDVVPSLERPVLLLHGEADQLSPLPSMRELATALKGAGCPGEIHVYPGADHGFAVSTHKGYKADAAADGFKRGVAFLVQNLR
ncbi:MAG TPA: dienelactone hydrolase family protein [Candidatus Acidoferrales bacterium]|nr:dienelactone hydrolase family protein [Candidatus Acidoferrales bacterium]